MLTTQPTSGGLILTPEQVDDLLVLPFAGASIAAAVSMVVTVTGSSFRVPVQTTDPDATWTAEGAEITPSDAAFDEAVADIRAIKGLSIVSSELAADAEHPGIGRIIGAGLARKMVAQVDSGFLGGDGSPAPGAPVGLASLQGTSNVAGTLKNTDWAVLARTNAEMVGASLDAFLMHPLDAAALAMAKESDASQRHLIEPDARKADQAPASTDPTINLTPRFRVEGINVYTSAFVERGTSWGIPRDRVFLAIRQGSTLAIDSSVLFTSDRVAIRAVMRVGWVFAHPAAIQRIALTSGD